jgi:SAM-dependent methyltransferase
MRTHGAVPMVRADMRHLPFGAGTFDVVVNLFTSFGYFADDAQHQAVLCDAASRLRRGGAFVLDFLNASAVREGLVPREERVVGSQRVVIQRRIDPDGNHVIKEMQLLDDGRSFIERVRLFTGDELVTLMRTAGLDVRHRFGDYDGSPPGASASRAILIGIRP